MMTSVPAQTATPALPLRLSPALRWIQRREFPRKLGICDRLFGRTLSAHGICWVRTAPGPVWKLDLKNQTHRWIVYGYYEGPGFWHWLKAHRDNVTTIVDSGANIGQTVLYFAALTPAARVIAYEPGEGARAWLRECVAANALRQVQIEAAGLGAKPGAGYLSNVGAGDLHGSWNCVSTSGGGEPINIASLDDEIARHGLGIIDLWKIDMEGYELEALRGAERAISAGRIRAIHVEAAGESGQASTDFLRHHGYVVHGITPSGRLTSWKTNDRFENALCIPGS